MWIKVNNKTKRQLDSKAIKSLSEATIKQHSGSKYIREGRFGDRFFNIWDGGEATLSEMYTCKVGINNINLLIDNLNKIFNTKQSVVFTIVCEPLDLSTSCLMVLYGEIKQND